MNLAVAPEGLGGSGQQLQQVATRFGEALGAFQAQLQAFGQPWGSDDIGSLIGAAHDEVSSFAFECYGAALEEISQAGADLSAMAAKHQNNETEIGKLFSKLADELAKGNAR
ncbi:hypothetical protein [Longispora albida]|uniref:hypothetical protein n=1 Tax=Longispora albida TaxID=203523 RepID=UPI0003601E51|nr:hypothetical protein [Longispora albida]